MLSVGHELLIRETGKQAHVWNPSGREHGGEPSRDLDESGPIPEWELTIERWSDQDLELMKDWSTQTNQLTSKAKGL